MTFFSSKWISQFQTQGSTIWFNVLDTDLVNRRIFVRQIVNQVLVNSEMSWFFFQFLKTTYTSHIRVSDQIWLEVERTAGRLRGPDPSLCLVNTSEKRSIWKAWISDNLWPNQEIKHSLWRFNLFFSSLVWGSQLREVEKICCAISVLCCFYLSLCKAEVLWSKAEEGVENKVH